MLYKHLVLVVKYKLLTNIFLGLITAVPQIIDQMGCFMKIEMSCNMSSYITCFDRALRLFGTFNGSDRVFTDFYPEWENAPTILWMLGLNVKPGEV